VDAISAHVDATLLDERVTQAKTSGFRFARRLTLKPGVYQARIGVGRKERIAWAPRLPG